MKRSTAILLITIFLTMAFIMPSCTETGAAGTLGGTVTFPLTGEPTGTNPPENTETPIFELPESVLSLLADIEAVQSAGKKPDNKFAAVIADFTAELMKRVSAGEPEGAPVNLVPLSVLYALGMVHNGADGGTLAQFESTVGMSLTEVNEYLAGLTAAMDTDHIRTSNSMWIRNGFGVKNAPLTSIKQYYKADVFEASFGNETAEAINGWVAASTNGMIKKVIDKIDDNTMMYLINAVCLEAEWAAPYYEHQIKKHAFTDAAGNTYDADFLFSSENTWIEVDGAVGTVKPYKDSTLAMYLILPEGDLGEFIASLDGELLGEIIQEGKDSRGYDVTLAMPEFKQECGFELNDILSAMGMSDAMNAGTANFTGFSDMPLFIGSVKHDTFIQVDRDGTKGAGSTVVDMVVGKSEPDMSRIKELTLDRPFMYMVVDTATSVPYFIGTVNGVAGYDY